MRWAVGGFCGYSGSVWVIGEWAVVYWIVFVLNSYLSYISIVRFRFCFYHPNPISSFKNIITITRKKPLQNLINISARDPPKLLPEILLLHADGPVMDQLLPHDITSLHFPFTN